MSTIRSIIPVARKIISRYDLCYHCLGRVFSKKLGLVSNKLLGKKIYRELKLETGRCYVCKNIFDHVDSYVDIIIKSSSDYQFSTFLVGTIMQPSISERDDLVRSKFNLRGIESVKTDITREFSKKFAKRTKRKPDSISPDIIITLNIKERSCVVHSKPIVVFGRYSKLTRGLPQKQVPCDQCLGKGCRFCDYHGISEFNSVEGILSKYFFTTFSARRIRFTWIGGEDKTSLVQGKGRPFFAQIVEPKKRKIRLLDNISLDNGAVRLKGLRVVTSVPKQPVKFKSKVNISVSTDSEISDSDLKNLENLKNTFVELEEKKGKNSTKQIHDLTYNKTSDSCLELSAVVEGGVPIKRLVEGDSVSPNISELLDKQCTCKKFDFKEVYFQLNNGNN